MKIDLKALQDQYNKLSEGGGSSNSENNIYYQIQDGSHYVRILPGKTEDDNFFAETKIHRVPQESDPESKSIKNFHCRRVHGEECPLCNLYYDLWKEDKGYGSDLHKTWARKIKPRDRYYFNVFDRESEEVKVLSVGVILYKKIIGTILDEDFGPGFLDMKEGHDFKIHKYIEDGWPKYDQSMPRPKSSVVGDAQLIEAMPEMMHDIQSLVRKEDYDAMTQQVNAITGFMAGVQIADDDGSDEYLDKLQS